MGVGKIARITVKQAREIIKRVQMKRIVSPAMKSPEHLARDARVAAATENMWHKGTFMQIVRNEFGNPVFRSCLGAAT